MRLIADLHIHSRFSRATSKELTLPVLHAWAQRKGINLLGTGDLTHPVWFSEMREQLVPAEPGLFRLRDDLAAAAEAAVPRACRAPVRFLLQGEISNIYKHDESVRKVHNLVFCPDLDTARRFDDALGRVGNIVSDGRPILGLPSRDLLELVLESGEGAHLIPAHVWTPWFSILGSKSGYDSVEQCFGDLADHVFALETGLSSDPAMNWRLSALDRYALVSNSDAHSPSKLGREANEFEFELEDGGYHALFDSLRSAGDGRFLGTIEFYPEEGKYHLDGHRKCGQRLTPRETLENDGRCPTCGKKVTVGVLHRVEALADRPAGARPEGARDFISLVPLAEVIGEALAVGAGSKRVARVYDALLSEVGPEFFLLRQAPLEDVRALAGPAVAEGISRVREGRLKISAGYDGEFGAIHIFDPEERSELSGQNSFFPALAPRPRKRQPKAPPAARPAPAPDLFQAAAPETAPGIGDTPTLPLGPGGLGADAVLASLNPEQIASVTAPRGPLAVVAGPGTGKTRTLTHRIAYKVLRGEVRADRVLAVTFTNRAAGEMQERLAALLGEEQARGLTVCTLHRLGLDVLRAEHEAAGLAEDFVLFGEDEAVDLLRRKAGIKVGEARRARQAISAARRGGAARKAGGAADDAVRELHPVYRDALAAANAIDLDDLIVRPVELLEADAAVRRRWQERYAFIAVDELQDLDVLQYRLLAGLAPPDADITVIGDPDQAIYGFRGAERALFDRLIRDREGTARVTLTRNYRSTPVILQASTQVLAADGLGGHAELAAFLQGGPRVKLRIAATDGAEAEFVVHEVEQLVGGTSHFSLDSERVETGEDGAGITFGDVAVLYRLKAQRKALEQAFTRSGMPYRVVGNEPAWLRGKGAKLLKRLRRAEPGASPSGLLREQLEALQLDHDDPLARAWLAAAARAVSVNELLERVLLRTPDDDYDSRAEQLTLLTMHAAKGLEFPVVFLTGCEEGLLPYLREGEEPDVDEERRLLYVGMTRARHLLYLTRARKRTIYGKRRTQRPSRFLADVEQALLEVRQTMGGKKKQKKDPQLDLL